MWFLALFKKRQKARNKDSERIISTALQVWLKANLECDWKGLNLSLIVYWTYHGNFGSKFKAFSSLRTVQSERGLEYADCKRGLRLPQKEVSGYNTKLHLIVWLLFWTSEESRVPLIAFTPSLTLLPVLLWPGVVTPVSVPPMSQVDLFKNYEYLIWLCRKKSLKKCIYKHIMNAILKSLGIK